MKDQEAPYIPALNRPWLTPAYDWVLKNIFREQLFKSALVREAQFTGDERILDIGCGTGTLTVELARACPRGDVVGLDGDREILERARAKAATAGVHVRFDYGFSFALPYPDKHFDRVTSSLMLHHLTLADKVRTLHEVLRVLCPDGQLHIVDFGKPEGLYARLVSSAVTIHFEHTRENLLGELPDMLRDTGFAKVREGSHFGTVGGTVRILHAAKPRSAALD